jgi:hypothetical protein
VWGAISTAERTGNAATDAVYALGGKNVPKNNLPADKVTHIMFLPFIYTTDYCII